MGRVVTSMEHTARDQLLAVVTADILIQTHGSALGNLDFMKRVLTLLTWPGACCLADSACVTWPRLILRWLPWSVARG